MKTQIIASSLALAFALFACASPPSEGSEGEEETAAQTDEAELRTRLNETGGCALTCSGGSQTCCCAVGQKCESGATYCVCKSATDTRFNATMLAQ